MNLHLSPVKRFFFIFSFYYLIDLVSSFNGFMCKDIMIHVCSFLIQGVCSNFAKTCSCYNTSNQVFCLKAYCTFTSALTDWLWYTASLFLVGFPWMYISIPCYIVLRLQWNEIYKNAELHHNVRTFLCSYLFRCCNCLTDHLVLSIVYELYFSHHKVRSQRPF